MPFSVVQAILDESRAAYLNDPNKTQISDANLLSALKTAYSWAQNKFELNDLQIKYKTFKKKITTGDSSLGGLPGDFVWPLNVEERIYGSSDEFSPMIQRTVEPMDTPAATALIYWSWRDLDDIKFTPASTDREVRLTYLSSFPVVNTFTDNIFGNLSSYLCAKVAAIVHLFINQNTTLASECDKIAENELQIVIRNYVKKSQAVPSSPLPYLNSGW